MLVDQSTNKSPLFLFIFLFFFPVSVTLPSSLPRNIAMWRRERDDGVARATYISQFNFIELVGMASNLMKVRSFWSFQPFLGVILSFSRENHGGVPLSKGCIFLDFWREKEWDRWCTWPAFSACVCGCGCAHAVCRLFLNRWLTFSCSARVGLAPRPLYNPLFWAFSVEPPWLSTVSTTRRRGIERKPTDKIYKSILGAGHRVVISYWLLLPERTSVLVCTS